MRKKRIPIATQRQYTDWIQSLDHDSLFEETIHAVMRAASDSDIGRAHYWRRRACNEEWLRREGHEFTYYRALGDAVVKLQDTESAK